MNKALLTAAACVLLSLGASAASLDEFLSNLSVQARADPNGFAYRISSQFHVAQANVNMVLSNVKEPADAFMVYHLSQACGRPPEQVLETYRRRGGKGWGQLAKELGIKPGSREFHALKNGDLRLEGGHGPEGEPGQGKGKGKGHKKVKHG